MDVRSEDASTEDIQRVANVADCKPGNRLAREMGALGIARHGCHGEARNVMGTCLHVVSFSRTRRKDLQTSGAVVKDRLCHQSFHCQ